MNLNGLGFLAGPLYGLKRSGSVMRFDGDDSCNDETTGVSNAKLRGAG